MKKLLTTHTILSSLIEFSPYGLDTEIASIGPKVVEWPRHFYKNPELSNREFKSL